MVFRSIFRYNKWETFRAVVDGCGRLDVRHLILLRRIQFLGVYFIRMTVCCIICFVLLCQVIVCTITAWYQLLHATQSGMSVCIFVLVLLTDVVDELIQCLYFTFLFYFLFIYAYCINFCFWRIKMLNKVYWIFSPPPTLTFHHQLPIFVAAVLTRIFKNIIVSSMTRCQALPFPDCRLSPWSQG